MASFTRAQGPTHRPSVISPSLTFSDAPPPLSFHFDPTTLNPPSTRRHGRQAATQTGDRKQLINMVTPLHLPGPTWGGELSATKTKQPSTHTHTYTHTITVSGSVAHKECHSHNVGACRYKIFTQDTGEAETALNKRFLSSPQLRGHVVRKCGVGKNAQF